MKISALHKSVKKALLTHAKTMGDWVKPIKKKRRFRASSANTFMLGVMFDRSIEADRAWKAAETAYYRHLTTSLQSVGQDRAV